MKKIILGLSGMALLSTGLASEGQFMLSEAELLKQLESSPRYEQILSGAIGAHVNQLMAQERFETSLSATGAYQRSKEKAVSTLSAPTEKLKNYQIGINKYTPYGVGLGLNYTTQSVTNLAINDLSTARVVGQLSVDLYKDFLGKSSKALLREARAGKEEADLQKKINLKGLRLQVRNLYWSYIANYESKNLSQSLLASAKKQLALAQRRKKSDVADIGDIARLSSQVIERKSQIMQFEGAMKEIEVRLKELLGSIGRKELVIQPYNKEKVIKEFYQCLDLISTYKTVPLEYSLIDDLIGLKEKGYKAKRRHLNTYSDVDIKLTGEIGQTGSALGMGNSHDELFDDGRSYRAVGLSINLPLEGRKKESEAKQLLLAKHRFNSEKRELELRMSAIHSTVIDSAGLIKGIIENRARNRIHLKKALVDTRKKYRQARVTTQDLLQEEERYLSNAIQLISTQNQILQLMFDYFGIFTETKCSLNERL
jgi:outer membrane protein TolC